MLSKKQLEIDGEKEDELPEWVIVVDNLFSDEVVCHAVEKWLWDRGFEFGVKMISPEEARGSGLIKKLKQMDIESEKRAAIPMEAVIEELNKEDVESDRLIGKIEGIKESIIYEGKTIKECEQKFREAVLGYKKTKDI